MDDSGLVVHKRCLLSVKAGGIVPRPEDFLLLFFDNGVSAGSGSNVNGWGTLFLSFLVVLDPAGTLITNGDGVSENFDIDGEGRTTSWSRSPIRRHDESRFDGRVPVDHLINICPWLVFNIRVPYQTLDGWLFPPGHR